MFAFGLTGPPKQQTPAMSPSHAHTVGAASGAKLTPNLPSADEEEDDICPICDGDCTCNNKRTPSTTNKSTAPNVSTSPAPHVSPAQPRLKIRLIIPPTMLNKNRLSDSRKQKQTGETLSGSGNDDNVLSLTPNEFIPQTDLHQPVVPKRRGRPSKAVIAARKAAQAGAIDLQRGSGNEENTLSSQSRSQKRRAKVKSGTTVATFKGKGTTVKKTTSDPPQRRILISDSERLSDDDDDIKSLQFPTFVSACSTTSDNDESDTVSSFEFDSDSDSSIEAEEENFIRSEEKRIHDKARVRRELMGDEGGQKKRDPHNNWVIRPRKKSVGSSDDDMEVDSEDATEEEDEDLDEEGRDAEEDETDVRGPGAGYAGVATGWSDDDDDESSFDADLFFANLSDSDSGTCSSGEKGDDLSELDASPFLDTTLVRQEMADLQFEVTEGWDGQIVFTNGLRDGQGILDHDLELNAAQAFPEPTLASTQDSDVEMQTSDGADGEDEDDDCDLGESDGETTEEELVGPNGLPTDRAMMLFRLPTSVSAINPLSTMSPNTSPRPRNRQSLTYGQLDSLTPAEILSGKASWEDSDEHECDAYGTRSVTSSRGGVPVMGHFETGQCNLQKSAIINGSNEDVPSPFSRLKRSVKRSRPRSQFSSFNGVSLLSFSTCTF
jgi:hypothetical protein